MTGALIFRRNTTRGLLTKKTTNKQSTNASIVAFP
jgi:hypothetical protein